MATMNMGSGAGSYSLILLCSLPQPESGCRVPITLFSLSVVGWNSAPGLANLSLDSGVCIGEILQGYEIFPSSPTWLPGSRCMFGLACSEAWLVACAALELPALPQAHVALLGCKEACWSRMEGCRLCCCACRVWVPLPQCFKD